MSPYCTPHNLPTDLTGQRFGRLTVLSYLSPADGKLLFPDRRREGRWLCRCDCGVEKYINTSTIRNTKSCGCLNREMAAENGRTSGRIAKYIPDRRRFLVNRVANYYRTNANTRGIEWALSLDDVQSLILSECVYCGSQLSNKLKTENKFGEIEILMHNGIDRIDSTKGYVIGNVVPCCKICNTAKLNLSLTDFYEWVQRVYERIQEKVR